MTMQLKFNTISVRADKDDLAEVSRYVEAADVAFDPTPKYDDFGMVYVTHGQQQTSIPVHGSQFKDVLGEFDAWDRSDSDDRFDFTKFQTKGPNWQLGCLKTLQGKSDENAAA